MIQPTTPEERGTTRRTFRIHSFDADGFGLLTAPRLLGLCLDSAGISADSLGFGIDRLQRDGLTWVIGRIRLVLDAAIRVGDEIEVETWPSGVARSVALRDFRLRRAGERVGGATSSWFVLDMDTRMPVRPDQIIPMSLHPQTAHEVVVPRVIPTHVGPPDVRRRFEVRMADIDLNRHVTAASYLGWAMEAVPPPMWNECRLSCLDVQYLEECHLGARVASESTQDEGGTLRHRIVREEDEKELARLTTTWVAR